MPEEILDVMYIKRVVIEEAKKYPDIMSVMLIGSYAKGKATPESDIDLIMELKDADFDGDAYFIFLEKLEKRLEKEIDLLTRDGVELSVIRNSLLKGGRIIYVREE